MIQMNDYKFNATKNEIINFVENLEGFDICFIVRNIYSRFSLYFITNNDIVDFNQKIKEKFAEWIDYVEIISPESDSFIVGDLQNSCMKISEKVYFSERHVENTNWYIKDSYKELKTPVTSFYSFKGGVGRTTATILTAMLLARQGKKVLIIDFDLEAPGLASVFANQSENAEVLLGVKGFVDFLVDFEANKRDVSKISIDDYYFVKNESVLVGTNGGELVIVPAIATDSNGAESYIDKLSKANIKFGFGKDYVPDLFLTLLENKLKPDHILIDTRTGINDVGGLVFNRYSQNIFLIFYGNQQNMFGLESILPELIKLNEKDLNFYLVNSPVPKNPTDREEEINFYVEKSYDIFCEHFPAYIDSPPSQFDETADHFPINIPFNDQALILNSYAKLASLIEHSDNSYQEIANIILKNHVSVQIEPSKTSANSTNKEILECIKNINPGAGTSEVEYKSEIDLPKYFYPRKDYKYIFDINKFLILGEKGVGKTALFSVLSHGNYAKALANYCGVIEEVGEKIEWVAGIRKNHINFPDKSNFAELNDSDFATLKNYWIILFIKEINLFMESEELVKEITTCNKNNFYSIAKRKNIAIKLNDILQLIDNQLEYDNKIFVIIYDYLDSVLENDINRGRLISALITVFYDNLNRYSNIKAKIFLRNDIFEREVNDITDKVKIQNYAVEIKWEYNQLLNLVWKRLYEQNKNLSIFKELIFEEHSILGSIPNLNQENEHDILLDKIFGKNMGGNNKAYPYNWLRIHAEDTIGQIHPRTLIRLFSESAILELKEREQPKDRVIRSKNIEVALSTKVSKLQVDELREEYPEFKTIFDNLTDKVEGRSPINEKVLLKALEELKISDHINTISKLKDIGVLKDYKINSKIKSERDEKRYHIPDLYLFGLRLKRTGTR